MTNKDFTLLKDWVLSKNKYFNIGFANLCYDNISGRLRSTEDSEDIAAGVDDRFGNYFYIRHAGGIQYRRSNEQLSGCRNSQDIFINCTIVSVVNDAFALDLQLCVLNSLLRYRAAEIKPISGLIVREDVVKKEYPNMKANALEVILQNLGNKTIISIDFEYGTPFHPNGDDCPCQPCKTC